MRLEQSASFSGGGLLRRNRLAYFPRTGPILGSSRFLTSRKKFSFRSYGLFPDARKGTPFLRVSIPGGDERKIPRIRYSFRFPEGWYARACVTDRSASTPVNLEHLTTRLKQSGCIGTNEPLTIPELKRILCEKFATIDFNQAKRDVQPFIKNPSATDVWKPEFFCAITEGLRAQE